MTKLSSISLTLFSIEGSNNRNIAAQGKINISQREVNVA